MGRGSWEDGEALGGGGVWLASNRSSMETGVVLPVCARGLAELHFRHLERWKKWQPCSARLRVGSPHCWGPKATRCNGPMFSPAAMSPDLAVHVTNSGTTLAPPQCMPGVETADCRPFEPLYVRRYPYVPYLATHDAAFPLLTPALHVPSLHASINPWAWLL